MYSYKITKEEALNIELNDAFSLFEGTCDVIKLTLGVAVSTLFGSEKENDTPIINDDGTLKLNKKDIKKMQELTELRRAKNNG